MKEDGVEGPNNIRSSNMINMLDDIPEKEGKVQEQHKILLK